MEGFKFAPYSHTKLSTFYQCPKQFEYKYIDKIKPAFKPDYLIKGIKAHDAISKYPSVSSSNQDLLGFLKTDTGMFYDSILRRFNTAREVKIGFDTNFNITKYTRSNLINGIIDMMYINNNMVHLVDWKTGKSKTFADQDWSQLETYAIAFLDRYDVNISYVYLSDGTANSKTLKKEQRGDLVKGVKTKIECVETASCFTKSVTRLCDYCDYKDICMSSSVDLDNIKVYY